MNLNCILAETFCRVKFRVQCGVRKELNRQGYGNPIFYIIKFEARNSKQWSNKQTQMFKTVYGLTARLSHSGIRILPEPEFSFRHYLHAFKQRTVKLFE